MECDLVGYLRASPHIRNLDLKCVKDLQKEKDILRLHLCHETDLKLSYGIRRLGKRELFFIQLNELG